MLGVIRAGSARRPISNRRTRNDVSGPSGAAHSMTDPHLAIVIVGAGFSGTIAALHLLDRLPSRALLLCERSPAFGRAAAYAASSPVHLLNVRAAKMSAYPDQPDRKSTRLNSSHANISY